MSDNINRQAFEKHTRELQRERAEAILQIDAAWAAKITSSGDPESDHAGADNVLCELLASLGFHKTVEAFRQLRKWYA